MVDTGNGKTGRRYYRVGRITKAEKEWNTRDHNKVFAKRDGDDSNLYLHTAVFSTDGYKHEETKIELPNDFKADDIKEIVTLGIQDAYCIILNNNDVFMCRYNEWTKLEDVSSILKETQTMVTVQVNGYYCFLFNDGYLYVVLTDETAGRFENDEETSNDDYHILFWDKPRI